MKDTTWLIFGIIGIVFAAVGLVFAFQTVTKTIYFSHTFGEYIPYTETSMPYLIPGLVIGAFGGLLATVGFAVFVDKRRGLRVKSIREAILEAKEKRKKE